MEQFIAHHRSDVTAVVSGFDRLVFRGTLLPLMGRYGMVNFLERAFVQLVEFKPYVELTSNRVKQAAYEEARSLGRPLQYLESSGVSKEDLARRLLAAHPVERGLICTLTAVEPCVSFEYQRSADKEQRGLKLRRRKCLHLYKYYLHPRFGFLNVRLQTWFPFHIQICLNGREWLARQLAERGATDFVRHDNCFTRLGDPDLAQRLLDQQLTIDWKRALSALARDVNPLHDEIFQCAPMDYYWSAFQTEWATDVLFRDPKSLAAVYPALVRHATHHFHSPDVLRFLGHKLGPHFKGELTSSFKDRPEGVRVKHYLEGNSIKMYDKAGSVLRVETTIGNPKPFKVFRPAEGADDGKYDWRPLRKGVADLHRRAQVSQRANNTYLDALSAVSDDTPASQVFDEVARPARWHDRRVRALKIGDPNDIALLQAISRGEFATSGFRNADIRDQLYPTKRFAPVEEAKRLSARTGRLLRLLRAHGLIRKVQRSHRYRLTPRGQLLTAALFAARSATLKQLVAKAA